MYTLVQYVDIQSNYSLIVWDSDFSKNFSFSTISPVQIIVGAKAMKKAMFYISLTLSLGKKGNQPRQIYICIQMIDLRVD